MENTVKGKVKGRKVAVLAADGFDDDQLMQMKSVLSEAGAQSEVVSKFGGTLRSAGGEEVEVDKMFITTGSIMYDAVYVPGGKQSVETLQQQGDAIHFLNETFKHCKPIAATGEGVDLLRAADLHGVSLGATDGQLTSDKGVITVRNAATPGSIAANAKDALGLGNGAGMDTVSAQFIEAIGRHRFWERAKKDQVPA